MSRWAFDVIRLTAALAVNTMLLRRAQGLTSTSKECLICGTPRPRRARWLHTCDECLADPIAAMEHYRVRKETNRS